MEPTETLAQCDVDLKIDAIWKLTVISSFACNK